MRFAVAAGILAQILPGANTQVLNDDTKNTKFATILTKFRNGKTREWNQWQIGNEENKFVGSLQKGPDFESDNRHDFGRRGRGSEGGGGGGAGRRSDRKKSLLQKNINKNDGRLMNEKFPVVAETNNEDKTIFTSKKECDPRNKNVSSKDSSYNNQEWGEADVGILGCGEKEYCMESENSALGGFCATGYDGIEQQQQQQQQRLSQEDEEEWNHHHGPFLADHRSLSSLQTFDCEYRQSHEGFVFTRCRSETECLPHCGYETCISAYSYNLWVWSHSYTVYRTCYYVSQPFETKVCFETAGGYAEGKGPGHDCAAWYNDIYTPCHQNHEWCIYFDFRNITTPFGPGPIGSTCDENGEVMRTRKGSLPPYQDYCGTATALFNGGCVCDEGGEASSPYVCTACPGHGSIVDADGIVGVDFIFVEEVPCAEIEELGPLVAFYNGVDDEESCSAFQDIVASSCGCEFVPTVQPPPPPPSSMPSSSPSSTRSSMPSATASSIPSSLPTVALSSSPTKDDCADRGFDHTCLFNEDFDERRTTVCLQEIDEETGFLQFWNACWKNKDLVGIVPGDPIGDDSNWILSDCGCCDTCNMFDQTHLPVRGMGAKHCRRPPICTPDDAEWETCFAWGNGVVKTIKVCITHGDGTQDEDCVDPFFYPAKASDTVSCGGCISLN